MTVREKTQEIEHIILSPYASFSDNNKGRNVFEKHCDLRTDFQRDRDRILHSKSFRRLKHKTQVFITPEGDHYRTRLTHTLEVSQIARTIARALRLNEDLAEAISLGHDLGHTPFGHAGERALAEVCPFGFEHNIQSLRIVDELEDDHGLNLTWEVRDGIKNHTGDCRPSTLEGEIVRLADRFAYINHDIDDAMRGGIISFEQLPKNSIKIIGENHSQRINTLIIDVINNSKDGNISMSLNVKEAMNELREYMFKKVYIGSIAKTEEYKAQNMLKNIYEYFKENIEELPETEKNRCKIEGVDRVVCDYVAGMTDRYAVFIFNQLFVPKSWQIR